jgi:hypothetical protein
MSDAFKWDDFVHDIGTIMKDPVVDSKSDHESLGHDGTLLQIFKKHLQYFTEINDQDFPSPIRLLAIERERISMLKSLKSVDTDAILKSIKQKAQKTTQSVSLVAMRQQ